jgi:hypothetical protein
VAESTSQQCRKKESIEIAHSNSLRDTTSF